MQMYDMANGRGGGKQGISVFGPILLSYAHRILQKSTSHCLLKWLHFRSLLFNVAGLQVKILSANNPSLHLQVEQIVDNRDISAGY
ncbi:hypothetical protein I7I50_00501 [Histoplasma capsulatum G186AR]|uniref:Uncharacterized protein n=1 Tax=Ajellomyces capsulatus TaxID=5037 RepID=A0A8H8CUT8_AJECA|nr:hypothetical protein I7I52_07769 [Histoplasma capsulatum]QSS72603.1 hypothetical protein I7I50_00501 [Histoplasma capsulatum G186AR]